eukprot:358027-Chlamydomonas_euryale.AAC.3
MQHVAIAQPRESRSSAVGFYRLCDSRSSKTWAVVGAALPAGGRDRAAADATGTTPATVATTAAATTTVAAATAAAAAAMIAACPTIASRPPARRCSCEICQSAPGERGRMARTPGAPFAFKTLLPQAAACRVSRLRCACARSLCARHAIVAQTP